MKRDITFLFSDMWGSLMIIPVINADLVAKLLKTLRRNFLIEIRRTGVDAAERSPWMRRQSGEPPCAYVIRASSCGHRSGLEDDADALESIR
jgi:hypothetical protein